MNKYVNGQGSSSELNIVLCSFGLVVDCAAYGISWKEYSCLILEIINPDYGQTVYRTLQYPNYMQRSTGRAAVVASLVQAFRAFYGSQRLITVFTTARQYLS